MADSADERMESESDYSIFTSHSTKLKVKEIKEINETEVMVFTGSIFLDRGVFEEKWVEISFSFKYNLTHKSAIEFLEMDNYKEFSAKGIKVIDFLRLKAIGRKQYRFFGNEARSEIKAVKRIMNWNSYDDALRIKCIYSKRKFDYEFAKDIVKIEKDNYEKNCAELKFWSQRFKDLTSHQDE